MPSRLPFRHYLGSGAGLSLTERFTRIDAGTLEYQYTVDDPTVFVRPYTAVVHLHKDDTQRQIHEYACHEGNYGMLNSLSGGRAQEGLYLSEAARQAGEREAFYVRQREKLAAKLAERDERIADVRRHADEDRKDATYHSEIGIGRLFDYRKPGDPESSGLHT